MCNYSNNCVSKYNEEESIFNSEIYKLVDGNIYPFFPFNKIDNALTKYIVNNKIKINYLEFKKLQVANFVLEDYIKIQTSENLLEKRLFCSNNFKYICVNDFEPPIATIQKDYLNYIYDNINIFFNMLKLEAEHCVILILRYGMLNINTEKIIIDKLNKEIEQLHSCNIDIEKLENKKNEIDHLIILMKDTNLYGKELTLNECGEVYGVSRERIRQKVITAERKLVSFMNNMVDGNYDEIFLFGFNKRYFNDVFYISDFIINNRKSFCRELKYTDSLFTPFDFFEIYSGLWNKVEALYYSQNGYVNINGKWIYRSKLTLFKYLINKILLNPMNIEDIYVTSVDFLDKYIVDNRKNKSKELKSFAALIERQENIIKSNKHYRLRKSNNDEIFLEELYILIDSMPGFFSTKKLFDENAELMSKFDIIDQYELHYFLRLNIDYFSDKIIMERMPHISRGYSQEEYLIELLEESNYETLDSFLEHFSKQTGILEQSAAVNFANILGRYYLHNKRLKLDYIEPPVGYFESKYTLDMYSKIEYIADLQSYGYQQFLNNGFKIVWNYLIKDNSIRVCIFNQFDEFGLSCFSNISSATKNSAAFKTSLYYLRQELEIIKFDNQYYLKISKELLEEIKELINSLHSKLLQHDYCTLREFIELAKNEKFPLITNYQFGELFFIEILFSEKSIKLLYNIIYYEGTSPLGIIDGLIKEKEKISIWDIEHYLENTRSWKFNQNFIDRLKYDGDYYYVKELDSVFYDKRKFIKYLEEN